MNTESSLRKCIAMHAKSLFKLLIGFYSSALVLTVVLSLFKLTLLL